VNGTLPVNFDRSLSTPDMMPSLSKIARVLGPRGLMPNAKLNTIQPPDKMAEAVAAQASGMVQYRTDKNGNVMAGIGKGSFDKVSDLIYSGIDSFQKKGKIDSIV
jgi:large subunit ribosomal protein L1